MTLAVACLAGCSSASESTADPSSTTDAFSLPLTPTCNSKRECTISPSRRANFYRLGSRYQVDISGATTGESDNSYLVAVGENFGIIGETTQWVLDEVARRGLTSGQVSVRGTSLGAVDGMSIIIHGGASRATLFGVPSDPLFWFSYQLSVFHANADVSLTVIQGDHDPVAAGTRLNTWELDPRITVRWVHSPYDNGRDLRNHYREAYCPVAPETCFH